MNKISFMEISSGEYVGVCSIEITSIPDISIISSRYQDYTDIEKEYMNNFSSLASEVFQNYKYIISQNSNAEISMELLWVTEPVNNQPYKAKIRPFLVIRAISGDQSSAQAIIEQIYSLYESSLKLQKYGFEEIEFPRLTEIISGVQIEDSIAIVKDEREENLNNQFLSAAYSIDVFDSYAHDMSSIMNELTEQPYSMFSIQLFPTQLTVEEKTEIARIAQILDTLNKGVMTQGIGNVSISAAGHLAEIYKYYQTVSAGAMFGYNIIVAGSYGNTDKLASKVQGYISYDSENPVFMKQVHMDTSQLRITDNYYSFPWIVNELLIDLNRNPYIWNQDNSNQFLYRMPYVISAKEAGGIFRLPLGNGRISAGLPINDSESASKTYADNLINAGDIEIGILKNSEKNTIGISLKDLAKHMLVVGTPGSGKTTFSVSLLDRLWKEHNIPFLVIEPAKNEYRALIQSIPEIQIFTPGKNFISPFVFNPFVPPENVRLETYKSTLKTAFAAAVSMTTPLDKIFEEAINNCYSDFRWLDNYTTADKGQIFNITDFIKCFKNTFDEIGYTGDAKNIGRAGVVRLKSLENLFDNYFSIPIQDLLQKPTIIELAAIENSDQKALIISLLLLSILAYVNANYVGDGGLKNVMLLEEAHVLLDASSNVGQGDTNPSAIAQNLVKRMLAEIRSYGVGIIIADQSPRKVSTDVVALTDMKMVFRLVEATDKQIIADSMNMGDGQEQRLSRLKPGEAFLFFNKLDSPEEVVTPDYRLENNIDITLSDKDIGKLITYWNDKKKNLRPYPECEEVLCCKECCIYERRILAKEIARRIFVKNFKSDMSDFNTIKKVFAQITKLTKYELNDEEFSPELLACVKVQLWRKIVYGTNISRRGERPAPAAPRAVRAVSRQARAELRRGAAQPVAHVPRAEARRCTRRTGRAARPGHVRALRQDSLRRDRAEHRHKDAACGQDIRAGRQLVLRPGLPRLRHRAQSGPHHQGLPPPGHPRGRSAAQRLPPRQAQPGFCRGGAGDPHRRRRHSLGARPRPHGGAGAAGRMRILHPESALLGHGEPAVSLPRRRQRRHACAGADAALHQPDPALLLPAPLCRNDGRRHPRPQPHCAGEHALHPARARTGASGAVQHGADAAPPRRGPLPPAPAGPRTVPAL